LLFLVVGLCINQYVLFLVESFLERLDFNDQFKRDLHE